MIWESTRPDYGSRNYYDVYGQRYDSSGVKVGVEFQVNTTDSIGATQSSVTSLTDGGFVTIWGSVDNDVSGNDWDVYGQRYDSAGVKVGVEFQVNTTTSGNQSWPSITTLDDGGFVAIWQSLNQDGDESGVFGQRYDSAGVKVGGEFQVNTTTSGNQSWPSITTLDDGGFVAIWSSYGQDGSGWGVYGQRYDSSGVKVGVEFQVNTTTAEQQQNPSITGLSDGGFVTTWYSNYQYPVNNIYGQRFDSTGQAVTTSAATTGVSTLVFNSLNLNEGDRITVNITGGTQVQGLIGDDGLDVLLTSIASNIATQTGLFSGASASNGMLTLYGLTDGAALPEVTTTLETHDTEFTAADAQTHHTLGLSGTDAEAFEIVNGQLKLKDTVSTDYETKSSYAVTVTATDSGGLFYSENLTVSVNDANEVPTAISLSSNSVDENSAGAVVGTLSTTDIDSGDSHTYALSDTDQDLFEIVGGQLKLKATLTADYETKSSYTLIVTATDAGGLSTSQDFTISVLDLVENEAPTAINLSNSGIVEKSNGVVVGILTVMDTDNTHTLTLSGYHAGLFEVSNNQLKLRSGVIANYETQSSYSVTVTATDSGGLSKSQDFFIGVTKKNNAPTAITLDSTTVAENAAGSHIANISGVDPDEDDLHYSITGGSDASSFEIVNDMLHLAAGVSADYKTQSSYSVILTATDLDGLTYNEGFTISITDIDEEKLELGGTLGNDRLNGFSGIEIIDGGEGVDRIDYSLSNNNVSFSLDAYDQLVILDSTKQSNTLTSVERIHFLNTAYALDTGGNAGIAAKAIIATFGSGSLNTYLSAALSLVDEGTSLESLCDLVIENGYIESLIGSTSHDSFVDHVFENVVGRMPNIVEQAIYTDYLDNGTHTKLSLLALAANTTLTENLVAENSVDLIGVPGSSDGELLAIQYDIGLG